MYSPNSNKKKSPIDTSKTNEITQGLINRIHKINDIETKGNDLYHNRSVRTRLAEKWKTLNDTEKQILRSERSQLGIKCYRCNTIGFFREICPNECISESELSDDDDIIPSKRLSKSNKSTDIQKVIKKSMAISNKLQEKDENKIKKMVINVFKHNKFYKENEKFK